MDELLRQTGGNSVQLRLRVRRSLRKVRAERIVDHSAHLRTFSLGRLRMLQSGLRSRMRLIDGFRRCAESLTDFAGGLTQLCLKGNYGRVHAFLLWDPCSARQ